MHTTLLFIRLRQSLAHTVRLCLNIFAQFETEIRAESHADGIHKAKKNGVRFGRKKKLPPSEVAELREKRKQGVLVRELMREHSLSKASVYRYLENSQPIVPPPVEENAAATT